MTQFSFWAVGDILGSQETCGSCGIGISGILTLTSSVTLGKSLHLSEPKHTFIKGR